MALLATGAFIGALLSSGVMLTIRKQWGRLLVFYCAARFASRSMVQLYHYQSAKPRMAL
jgi:hypothetical protein